MGGSGGGSTNGGVQVETHFELVYLETFSEKELFGRFSGSPDLSSA